MAVYSEARPALFISTRMIKDMCCEIVPSKVFQFLTKSLSVKFFSMLASLFYQSTKEVKNCLNLIDCSIKDSLSSPASAIAGAASIPPDPTTVHIRCQQHQNQPGDHQRPALRIPRPLRQRAAVGRTFPAQPVENVLLRQGREQHSTQRE